MKLETISEGWVTQRQPDTPTAIAAGPRCAVTRAGDVVCTFMVQSKLGINDFKPMLARSTDGGETWSEGRLLWPYLTGALLDLRLCEPCAGWRPVLFRNAAIPSIRPGETFWSEATQGLKANELFWSRSTDGGDTWAEPRGHPHADPRRGRGPRRADRHRAQAA